MRNEHAPEADISNRQAEEEWTVDSHTKIVATDAFGKMKFQSDSTSTLPRWVLPFHRRFQLLINYVACKTLAIQGKIIFCSNYGRPA